MPKQTSGTVEQKRLLLERIKEALKQPLPAGMKFENAPLSEVSARLSEALGLTVTLMSRESGPQDGHGRLQQPDADDGAQGVLAGIRQQPAAVAPEPSP